MEEGAIVLWHKSVGDSIAAGDILYEVEATGAGVLAETLVAEGAIAEVGQDICVVEAG